MRKKIRIYILDTEELKEPGIFERGLSQVTEERRKKVLRFRLEKDRLMSLGAGLLLKKAFRDEGFRTPPEIAVDENGKPFLPGNENLRFNISHSGGKAVLAVGNLPLGVDAELVEQADLRVAERFFLPRENTFIREKEDETDERFYRLWTSKESMMKAVGLGMKMGPETFEIRFADAGIRAVSPTDGELWYFSEHGDAQFKIALCCTEKNPVVTIRRVKVSDCL